MSGKYKVRFIETLWDGWNLGTDYSMPIEDDMIRVLHCKYGLFIAGSLKGTREIAYAFSR